MPANYGTRRAGNRGAPSFALQPYFKQGASVGNLSTSFPEPSGMARPTLLANDGFIFVQQDSGGPQTILAINLANAATAGSWTLQGVTQDDFEDMTAAAVGSKNYIYVADSGNNGNAANLKGVGIDVIIYRFPEPTITGSDGTILSGTIEAIQCVYPAGNLPAHRDCETCFADPLTGDLYLVTKRIYPAQVYKLPHADSYAGIQTLTYMGKLACDTSATSTVIGTGSKTFTTTLGLTYPLGMKLRVSSRANAANYMEGVVTAQSGTSLTLYMEVNTPTLSYPPTGGSGTLTDWDISLAKSFVGDPVTGNNGVATSGDMSPAGDEIAICNYGGVFLWQKLPSETVFAALSRAPIELCALPGGSFRSGNNTPPGFPQRESIAFSRDARSLYTISEYVAAIETINPLVRNIRAPRPVTTLQLQQGLNGYSGASDTYIDSTVPALAGAALTPIIADINFATATTFSSASSAAAGAQTTIVVASATGFVVGCGVRIGASSVAGYVGTWEVAAIAGTSITIKVAFISTATGTSVQAHSQNRIVLLKFATLTDIPAGSIIVDAALRLFVSTEGEAMAAHRMKITWADTDTFTSLGGIVAATGVKCESVADATIARGMATFVGFFDLPLPVAVIQGWRDGTITNYGWAIMNHVDDSTGNGYQLESCESLTQTRKPMLIVSYISPGLTDIEINH